VLPKDRKQLRFTRSGYSEQNGAIKLARVVQLFFARNWGARCPVWVKLGGRELIAIRQVFGCNLTLDYQYRFRAARAQQPDYRKGIVAQKQQSHSVHTSYPNVSTPLTLRSS